MSLPTSPLSANVGVSSANGRAVELNTPPTMSANGTTSNGGPYDGIVTLNSTVGLQFNRPTSATNYDAQMATEHEIDEILGLGSHLGSSGSDLHPQDLFSWSSPGVRNLASSGVRYFSINGGSTNIVNFNQNSAGDFGDWQSPPCPQANQFVQNAFACAGQFSDITATSPEGISLDVIGYNLVNSANIGMSCMQPNSATRCYSNYSQLASVFQSNAGACLNYCNSNNAEACEWNSISGQCYAESGATCLEDGVNGWYAGVSGVSCSP